MYIYIDAYTNEAKRHTENILLMKIAVDKIFFSNVLCGILFVV